MEPRTNGPYRILAVEDSPTDAELIERELRKSGLIFQIRRVESRQALEDAIEGDPPDLILSDYNLPGFSGFEALELARKRCPDAPFIFISGTIGEEAAIDTLKKGATDYILKDRLDRLSFCVQRALREAGERKEHQRLQAQYLQAQKLESIGRLAGGVAHDFNNILTAILGYSEFLAEGLPAGDPRRADVEEIKRAGERAAALTRQLLAFSRQQVLQPRVLDLNALVRGIQKMLERIIGEDVELSAALAPDLGRVKADPGQIEQVIVNLVVNARDAMPRGGKITIETADVELDQEYAREHPEIRPGPYVMLSVSDNGYGMDAVVKARLFEPFFTTKERGKGTGLGLSTVYGIVKQSGGSIYVYSEPGQGATFKIYLPKVSEEPEPAFAVPAPASVRGSETILLVEDDETVRKLVNRVLVGNGYEVLEARDSREALQLCEFRKEPVHLLLTDIVMPGIRGEDLSKLLSSIIADIKVIFMSGYTEAGVVRHEVLGPDKVFLQKPINPEILARKVREVLDHPARR